MKRWIALFLTVFLMLSVVPIAAADEKKAAEPEDLWETIARIEASAAPAAEKSVNSLSKAYAGCMDQIIAAIEASDSYKPGTLFENNGFYFWETKDGVANGYSPEMRAKLQSGRIEGANEKALSRIETVSYADKGGSPANVNVAVMAPYYGFDSNIGPQYLNQGRSLAAASGGSCLIYYGTEATIDALATELERAGIVLVNSHGTTDANDNVEQANTSYICLKNSAGVTSEDMQLDYGPNGYYYHAIIQGDVTFVDGTAIANHMDSSSPNGMLWSCTCDGMATDGLAKLHNLGGVEVVFGYSRSVSMAGDELYEEAFFSKIKEGKDVKTAAAYMKEEVGVHDPYYVGNPYAYPIFVSSEDAYPGQGLVDDLQNVRSPWTYFGKPVITQQPVSATIADGKTATFQVKATGSDLSYRWQVSKDGGSSWSDCSAAHSDEATFYFFAKTAYNGFRYRCRISNSYATVYSSAAKLTVSSPGGSPVITDQPASITVANGKTATFRVAASGSGLSYRWQVSKDGGSSWSDCSAAHSDESTFYFFAQTAYNGFRYRCKVSNSNGTVYSSAAKLTVSSPGGSPVIIQQPASLTVADGKTATFRVEASGSGLSYRWQVSKDGGSTWSNCSAAHSDEATFYFFAQTAYNGFRYRCKVSNSNGSVYSSAVKLTVTGAKPVIKSQSSSITVAEGKTATFRVEATGSSLSYRWQVSKDGGSTWSNCSAAHSDEATFYFFAQMAYNGFRYRCKVSNSYGTAYSTAVKLTVTGAKPVIKSQSSSITVAEGKTATFRVEATGSSLSYRWQVSKDGGSTWSNCSAAHSDEATFYFFAQMAYNGFRYRCKVSNSYGTVYSTAVKLTVTGGKPVITGNPASATVTEGKTVTMRVTANGSNLSYRWQKSKDGGATWQDCTAAHSNESTFYFFAQMAYNGWLYRCKVSNSHGSSYSTTAKLTVSLAAPTIAGQPGSVSVKANSTASFAVTAVGTDLHYQWQKSADGGKTWQNCTASGAKSANFVFTALKSYNGMYYRCKVYNTSGTVYSSAAKLTVY